MAWLHNSWTTWHQIYLLFLNSCKEIDLHRNTGFQNCLNQWDLFLCICFEERLRWSWYVWVHRLCIDMLRNLLNRHENKQTTVNGHNKPHKWQDRLFFRSCCKVFLNFQVNICPLIVNVCLFQSQFTCQSWKTKESGLFQDNENSFQKS